MGVTSGYNLGLIGMPLSLQSCWQKDKHETRHSPVPGTNYDLQLAVS